MKDFTLDQKKKNHHLEGVVVKRSKVLIYWYNLMEKISYALEILSLISNSVLMFLEEYLFWKIKFTILSMIKNLK